MQLLSPSSDSNQQFLLLLWAKFLLIGCPIKWVWFSYYKMTSYRAKRKKTVWSITFSVYMRWIKYRRFNWDSVIHLITSQCSAVSNQHLQDLDQHQLFYPTPFNIRDQTALKSLKIVRHYECFHVLSVKMSIFYYFPVSSNILEVHVSFKFLGQNLNKLLQNQ